MPRNPCIECGVPTSFGARCAEHAAPLVAADNARRHAKQRDHGRNRADVKRAMRCAIERDRQCKSCGSSDDLTAHFKPGGFHTPNPDDYVTYCRSCHGRVDAPRARRRHAPS